MATDDSSAPPRRASFAVQAVFALLVLAAGAYLSLAPTILKPRAFEFRTHPAPRTLPDIAFEDGAGSKLALADFRGRVVLLNLWATWCPPCRKEMPSLERLQRQLGGAGFQVVALSVDALGMPAVRRFYEEADVRTLAAYIDTSGQALPALGVTGLPTTLLIDASGREIGRVIGPAEWDSPEAVAALRRHLGPPPGSS